MAESNEEKESKEVKFRYYLLKGKATIAQTPQFTLVLLHDDEVNPRRETLAFKPRLKRAPNPGPGHIIANKSIEILISFDRAWFEDTMKKGFLFPHPQKNGFIVEEFEDLDPQTEDRMADMNPIEPV
ncbi:hypothetical protein GCM10028805_40370 [Spirosoma harenae]